MKVSLYARVSSDRQDVVLSITGQLRALRECAAKNGHVVVNEYVDEAESARTMDRPRFQEMLAAARGKDQPFEAILVWSYSRFTRNLEDAALLKGMLKRRGIKLISITEPFDDSPHGEAMGAILDVFNHLTSAVLAQDVVRGMRESATRGFYPGGTIPFGYRRVRVQDGREERTKLVPDASSAPTVVRIFKECVGGKGLREIANTLNSEGIPAPRGALWKSRSVHRVLTNEAHTGTMIFDRERPGRLNKDGQPPIRVENAWQPIVDSETFSLVRSLLHQRAPLISHPRAVSSSYLLSSLLQCAKCGHLMTGHSVKHGQYRYYVCSTADQTSKSACGPGLLPKERMERFIVDRIRAYLLSPENLTELVKQVQNEIHALTSQGDEQRRTLAEQITDIDRRLGRLYDALETGNVAIDDLGPRIGELKSRRAQVQQGISDLTRVGEAKDNLVADLVTVKPHVHELSALLEEASFGEQKAFLRSFVKSIDVWPEKVLVRYTLPIPSNGTRQETIHSLSTMSNGTPGGTRTPDARLRTPPLYPTELQGHLVEIGGLEPPTSALRTPRSPN